MRIWSIVLVALLSAGCMGNSPHMADSSPRLAAQAEWAFACAQAGVSRPGEAVSAPMDDSVGVSPELPVVCAYAPAWSADSQAFLEWYNSPDNSPDNLTGFTLKLASDDEIPDNLTEYPAFTLGDKAVVGWTDLEALKTELVSNAAAFEGRRGREPKREHDVPMGAVNQADILPLFIGDGLTLTRSGPDVTVPLGGKVALVIPSGMQVSASHSGDETVLSIEAGNPVVRLPWIGRLWPIKVEGMRLSGDTLTVELDGWKDYQIKVLP